MKPFLENATISVNYACEAYCQFLSPVCGKTLDREESDQSSGGFKERVMSQLISQRSNSLEIHAHREPSLGSAGDILLAVPRALLRAVRRAWTTHSDQKLLQELTDHQLRDIGIRREHIPHMIRHGWDV